MSDDLFLYKTEDRADLEDRFKVMGAMLQRVRDEASRCTIDYCPVCEALTKPVDLPETIAQVAHEPREDLERGVELIVERITDVLEHEDAEQCTAGAFALRLIRDVQQHVAETEE